VKCSGMDRGFHLGLFDSIITNSFADMLFTPPSPGIGRASASRVVPGLFLPDLSFRLKPERANGRRPTICAVSPELRSCARGLELDKAVLQLIPDRRYQIHDARPIRRAAIGRSAGPLSSAARSPTAVGVRLDTQHVGGPVDPAFHSWSGRFCPRRVLQSWYSCSWRYNCRKGSRPCTPPVSRLNLILIRTG
jgi:hypothetical protein